MILRRLLPLALCWPAVSLFGCTGATAPDVNRSTGAVPVVEMGEEPTPPPATVADATSAATSEAAPASENTAETKPAATAETTPAVATASTGEPAPAAPAPEATSSAAAMKTSNEAKPAGEAKPSAAGETPAPEMRVAASGTGEKLFQTPETDAAAEGLREAPRSPAPPRALSAEERAKRLAEPIVDLTFDDLQFAIEKDALFDWSMATEKMLSLRGRRVRIRGFIHPSSAFASQLRDFIFVRDNQECCFGPGAAVFDCMSVTTASSATVRYTVLPIAVEGVLDLDPFEIDGVTRMLYRLDDAVSR